MTLNKPVHIHFRSVNRINSRPQKTPIISHAPRNRQFQKNILKFEKIRSLIVSSRKYEKKLIKLTSNHSIDLQMLSAKSTNVQQHAIVRDNIDGPANVHANHVPYRSRSFK